MLDKRFKDENLCSQITKRCSNWLSSITYCGDFVAKSSLIPFHLSKSHSAFSQCIILKGELFIL